MCYDVVWEYFDSRFGPSGVQPIGVSTVIREILYRQYLNFIEAENRAIDEHHRAKHERQDNAKTTNIERTDGSPLG